MVRSSGSTIIMARSSRCESHQRVERIGVAPMLLTYLIAEAERMGFLRLSLEAEEPPSFRARGRLYGKYGFELCGPFADYVLDQNSVFMTKVL